jgi:hypothetical protein
MDFEDEEIGLRIIAIGYPLENNWHIDKTKPIMVLEDMPIHIYKNKKIRFELG